MRRGLDTNQLAVASLAQGQDSETTFGRFETMQEDGGQERLEFLSRLQRFLQRLAQIRLVSIVKLPHSPFAPL